MPVRYPLFTTLARRSRIALSLRLAVIPALVLLVILASTFAGALPGAPDDGPAAFANLRPLVQETGKPLIVYSEFGHDADTLWAANPEQPGVRSPLTQVRHAPGYGIYPSLSPGGTLVAYSALPPGAPGGTDAPAELRLFDVETGETRTLAESIDLLITPVWSPDGRSLIVRRSAWGDNAGSFELLRVDLDGATTPLASSSEGLFPIDVSPDGSWLYYATLSQAGTGLSRARTDGGGVEQVARLSDGVARDWHLSPDGTQLSYLAEAPDSGFVAEVLDVHAKSKAVPLSRAETAQFNPVWEPNGAITVGRLGGGRDAPLRLYAQGGSAAGEPLPAGGGFDVPLSWSPDGETLAVRAFEGSSLSDPGRSRVAVLTTRGERHELSRNSDLIIAGWLEVPE